MCKIQQQEQQQQQQQKQVTATRVLYKFFMRIYTLKL